MSDNQERDARLYLDALYAGKPEGSIVAIGPLRRPHWVTDPASAVPYVAGKRDVYNRITLLGRRPSKGRGTVADSIALPALWADIDIVGAPLADGKRKQRGAPSLEVAMEVAHATAQPSVLVDSGHGLHTYHLLEQMWLLRTEEDRAEAQELLAAWQATMRSTAEALGVTGLDSTHDLSRVLRPPGSLNAKRVEHIAPVRLLDDGGPRYTIEQLRGLCVVRAPEPVVIVEAPGDRDIDTLFAEVPRVLRLVARQGGRPGKGSASEWDFALGCEAAENGASDGEIATLIRFARERHGEAKGERDDYVERTVGKVRAKVGVRERSPDGVRRDLERALHLRQTRIPEFGVRDIRFYGFTASSAARIEFSDGRRMEFGRVGDISKPTRLGEELAMTLGISVDFTKPQALKVLALASQLADRSEAVREDAIGYQIGATALRYGQDLLFDFDDPESRFITWGRLSAHDPEAGAIRLSSLEYAARILIARDMKTGERYLRTSWLQQIARREDKMPPSPTGVRQLMLQVGWRQRGKHGQIDATHDGARLRLAVYVIPPEWESQ